MEETAATRYSVLPPGRDVVAEIEVKRSVFRCTLRRVDDEAQARGLVEEARRSHHDARHHCSAFVLGPDRRLQRSSDDGEPAGTAGMPMLAALTRRETAPGVADLSDVSAVVTRWFGGVLLGAGGLTRAYSDAVSAALEAAPFLPRRRLRLLGFDVDVAHAGRWESDLRNAGFHVEPAVFGATAATLSVGLADDADAVASFHRALAALTAGAVAPADVVDLGTTWEDGPAPAAAG